MTESAFVTALGGTGAPNRATLLAGLLDLVVHRVASADAVQALTTAYGAAGQIRALALDGTIYDLDPADTTSAHDGVTVLVSLDGKRFKRQAVRLPLAVEGRQSSPPVSPSVGQAWLVGAAPTGAWAAKTDHVALWTALGWRYLAPRVGHKIYDAALEGDWQFTAASAWVFGVSFAAVSPGTIGPVALQFPAGLPVQAQQNAPPGTVSGAYLVGAAPTGAWTGHAHALAVASSGAWSFIAGYDGAEVFNRALGYRQRFSGGVWVDGRGTGIIAGRRIVATGSFLSNGGFSPDAPTPPNVSSTALDADCTLTYAASRAGAPLEFTYQFQFVSAVAMVSPVLFIDGAFVGTLWTVFRPVVNVINGFNWTFGLTAADTDSHSYAIRIGTSGNDFTLSKRYFRLYEGIA